MAETHPAVLRRLLWTAATALIVLTAAAVFYRAKLSQPAMPEARPAPTEEDSEPMATDASERPVPTAPPVTGPGAEPDSPSSAEASGEAKAEPAAGSLCLAPFPPQPLVSEPAMSTTSAPGPGARFTFHIDDRPAVEVAAGQQEWITGLPTDRKVQVRIELNQRPFETFHLDFGSARDQRICLWLRSGYWHWVDLGWQAALGCRCGE